MWAQRDLLHSPSPASRHGDPLQLFTTFPFGPGPHKAWQFSLGSNSPLCMMISMSAGLSTMKLGDFFVIKVVRSDGLPVYVPAKWCCCRIDFCFSFLCPPANHCQPVVVSTSLPSIIGPVVLGTLVIKKLCFDQDSPVALFLGTIWAPQRTWPVGYSAYYWLHCKYIHIDTWSCTYINKYIYIYPLYKLTYSYHITISQYYVTRCILDTLYNQFADTRCFNPPINCMTVWW